MSELAPEQVFKNVFNFLDKLDYSNEVKMIAIAIRALAASDCTFVNTLIEDVKAFSDQQHAEKYEKLNTLYTIACRTAKMRRSSSLNTKGKSRVDKETLKEEYASVLAKLQEQYDISSEESYSKLAEGLGCAVNTVKTYLRLRATLPSKSFVDKLKTYLNMTDTQPETQEETSDE